MACCRWTRVCSCVTVWRRVATGWTSRMTCPRGRADPSPPSGGSVCRWSWPRVWRVACCARPSAIGAW
eukprot:2263323-Pyramimonas_sp.AAC.1